MTSEIWISLITFLILIVLYYVGRKSIASVFILSISIFVVGLPIVREAFQSSKHTRTDYDIIFTCLSIISFSLGVLIVALRYKTLGAFSKKHILMCIKDGINHRILRLSYTVIILIWCARAYRAYSYGILFSGSGNENTIANQDYIFVIAISLLELLSLGAYLYLNIFLKELKWLTAVTIFSEIIWALISGGRRNFIFFACVFIYSQYIVNKKQKIRIIISGVLSVILLFNIITPLFLNARVDILNRIEYEGSFEATANGISESVSDLWSGRTAALDVVSENFTERGDAGMFVGSIATSIASGNKHTTGEALLTSFIWSVPSALIPKPDLMVEQFIQKSLGIPLVDDSISWVAVGYADFGFAGCFIYGILYAIFIIYILFLSARMKNQFIFFVGSAEACFLAYSVESDPVVIFTAIRDMLILSTLLYCYKIISVAFFRKSNK